MCGLIWKRAAKKARAFGGAETFRYVVGGVLTVLVNVLSYFALGLYFSPLWANTWAFFIAVLFAYVANGLYVFRAALAWKSFSAFMGMRMGTLVLDDGGMAVLLAFGWDDLMAKCAVNLVIIVVNYLCSKFFIFR